MGKLFTFYNRAVEDSALVYVFEHDAEHYELMWGTAGFHGYVKPKEEIDAKVQSGEFQIVEDFRKKTPKDFVLDAASLHKYSCQFNLEPCPAFSATLAISKGAFLSTKEFKSIKELKEYVEALEKVFGS